LESFCLRFVFPEPTVRGVYVGIAATVAVTLWATLTVGPKPIVNLAPYNYPWDDLTIGAVGHVVMLVTGHLGSLFFASEPVAAESIVWHWIRLRRDAQPDVSAEHSA
jgi:hypothetical protein